MGIDMSKFPGFPGFSPGTGEEGDAAKSGSESSSSDGKKQHEMPNPETIHEHISKLLNGKIGALAKEIAEETAKDFDLGIDMENAENINMSNVFQKLFKNPGKLMNMVKSVGSKLDDKFKKGDIKESELMKEASDLLSSMKNMPGMGDLSSMLGKMGMSGLGGLAGLGGKGGKINMGALQSHLQQNMKNAKMKERMQSKLQQKQQQQQQQQQQPQQLQQQKASVPSNNGVRPTTAVYTASSGEQIQQTPRTAKPSSVSDPGNNIIITTTETKPATTDTGYEPVTETQKKKKKKNKK
jgi:DNA primase